VFANETDHERATTGESWRIEGARAAVAGGAESLTAEPESGGPIPLTISLSAREREILLAGGLLELVREGG
jgi:hypothetical protein